MLYISFQDQAKQLPVCILLQFDPTFQCLLQSDLVFKLNPGPTGDQSAIHAHCSVTRRRVPLSTRTRNHSNLNRVKRAPTTKHFNTPILEQQDNRAFQLCSLNATNKSTAFVEILAKISLVNLTKIPVEILTMILPKIRVVILTKTLTTIPVVNLTKILATIPLLIFTKILAKITLTRFLPRLP